jgi:hypothetical protein
MKRIETEVIINASPELIWEHLTDFSAYPDWNPFIREISGTHGLGEKWCISLQTKPEAKAMVFQPIVQEWNPKESYSWLGNLWVRGLFDGHHYFRLERLGEGQTKLVHGETFRGVLVGLILWMIGDDTRSSFLKMNQALKERVELVLDENKNNSVI